MKRLSCATVCALGLLLLSASAMGQQTKHAATFDASGHVLPVLVAVNAHGEVTKVNPAIDLNSAQQRALEKMVRGMIKAPAKGKDGKGAASQFVLMLAANPSKDNPKAMTFSYVSARPEPMGPLHWVSAGAHGSKQFALARPGQDTTSKEFANNAMQRAAHQPPPVNRGRSGGR